MLWTQISERISATVGSHFIIQDRQPLGGGCINNAYRLRGCDQDFFVKLNSADRLAMFAAEAAGLHEIGRSSTIRVPRPICWDQTKEQAYLVLEYIPLERADGQTMAVLGQQLALLHQVTHDYFGWQQDNTIGASPQINAPSQDWVAFWREQRLGFQLSLAANRGYTGSLQRKGERLMDKIGALFAGYVPVAALLHGDLWAGNAARDAQGSPVIFDPAVYYGDREADIAMTELFGGFGAGFYSAYRETYPLDEGYWVRCTLYNLYHILNHLNLFGRSYLGQAENMLDTLLAELY